MDTKKTRKDFALMKVCMPVTMSKDEVQEEEEKKRIEEQRNERRRQKGKDVNTNHSSRKNKSDLFNLEEDEYFEEPCWVKRHKGAWQREDGSPSDDDDEES